MGLRPCYTFCMCPGGVIVPATAYKNTNTVNGMSLYNRDAKFANSGCVAGVDPNKLLGKEASPMEMLDWLEALENKEGAQTLGIAAPESASKMMKQNINNIEQLGNTREFTEGVTNLDARMMGLQVLNPSNKLDIIDPTQIKEILSSEQNDSVLVAALNMTVGEIRAAYNQAVSQRVELKFKDKRNLIFTLGTSMMN